MRDLAFAIAFLGMILLPCFVALTGSEDMEDIEEDAKS
jgi:hypothetical protein